MANESVTDGINFLLGGTSEHEYTQDEVVELCRNALQSQYKDYCDYFIATVTIYMPESIPMAFDDWMKAGNNRPVAPY
jgi:hypothetical protein